MDDGWARLVVLLFGDPHLLEGGERSQDGASDPDRVFPFWRSNDLDLHGAGSQGSDLLLHPVSNNEGSGQGHDQGGQLSVCNKGREIIVSILPKIAKIESLTFL